jgi:hypothetical protein
MLRTDEALFVMYNKQVSLNNQLAILTILGATPEGIMIPEDLKVDIP